MKRDQLKERIAAFLDAHADGSTDPERRDALLRELALSQAEAVPPYGRLFERRSRSEGALASPALPTDVFRYCRVAAHDEALDRQVFHTSGTTADDRGVHPFRDLDLYDRAARIAAQRMLFPDVDRIALLLLAPSEDEAPHSSLSYMLSRFAEWFGAEVTWAMNDGALDRRRIVAALERAASRGAPLALLGTSFAFVHAEAALGEARFSLPPGSRIMQTGGFKGRSREVAPRAMRQMLERRYGVSAPMMVAEYGMTELSSQMYETTLNEAVGGGTLGRRRLWVPPWVRATPVDPESLEPVAEGTVGILRVDDLANLDSVCAIQTADLARRVEDGIELLGRAPGSTPRGCSIAADAALGGGG